MGYLNMYLDYWVALLPRLAAFFVLFTVLSKLMPCNPAQPIFRKDAHIDLIYSFVMPPITRFVSIMFLSIGGYLIFMGKDTGRIFEYIAEGYGPLGALPIWLQAAMVFIVSDIMLYWMHRWFHTRKMWPFHAIHHSPEHVDWMSAYRFHPVNTWLSFTLVDSLMLLAGFSPEAIICMGMFNALYSGMVHANLNWTFGPFKYIFASPVFHRWHHTSQKEGLDKNFAPTFPLLDIMFGTFYMPEGRVPEHFGAPESDKLTSFSKQIAWPFIQKK